MLNYSRLIKRVWTGGKVSLPMLYPATNRDLINFPSHELAKLPDNPSCDICKRAIVKKRHESMATDLFPVDYMYSRNRSCYPREVLSLDRSEGTWHNEPTSEEGARLIKIACSAGCVVKNEFSKVPLFYLASQTYGITDIHLRTDLPIRNAQMRTVIKESFDGTIMSSKEQPHPVCYVMAYVMCGEEVGGKADLNDCRFLADNKMPTPIKAEMPRPIKAVNLVETVQKLFKVSDLEIRKLNRVNCQCESPIGLYVITVGKIADEALSLKEVEMLGSKCAMLYWDRKRWGALEEFTASFQDGDIISVNRSEHLDVLQPDTYFAKADIFDGVDDIHIEEKHLLCFPLGLAYLNVSDLAMGHKFISGNTEIRKYENSWLNEALGRYELLLFAHKMDLKKRHCFGGILFATPNGGVAGIVLPNLFEILMRHVKPVNLITMFNAYSAAGYVWSKSIEVEVRSKTVVEPASDNHTIRAVVQYLSCILLQVQYEYLFKLHKQPVKFSTQKLIIVVKLKSCKGAECKIRFGFTVPSIWEAKEFARLVVGSNFREDPDFFDMTVERKTSDSKVTYYTFTPKPGIPLPPVQTEAPVIGTTELDHFCMLQIHSTIETYNSEWRYIMRHENLTDLLSRFGHCFVVVSRPLNYGIGVRLVKLRSGRDSPKQLFDHFGNEPRCLHVFSTNDHAFLGACVNQLAELPPPECFLFVRSLLDDNHFFGTFPHSLVWRGTIRLENCQDENGDATDLPAHILICHRTRLLKSDHSILNEDSLKSWGQILTFESISDPPNSPTSLLAQLFFDLDNDFLQLCVFLGSTGGRPGHGDVLPEALNILQSRDKDEGVFVYTIAKCPMGNFVVPLLLRHTVSFQGGGAKKKRAPCGIVKLYIPRNVPMASQILESVHSHSKVLTGLQGTPHFNFRAGPETLFHGYISTHVGEVALGISLRSPRHLNALDFGKLFSGDSYKPPKMYEGMGRHTFLVMEQLLVEEAVGTLGYEEELETEQTPAVSCWIPKNKTMTGIIVRGPRMRVTDAVDIRNESFFADGMIVYRMDRLTTGRAFFLNREKRVKLAKVICAHKSEVLFWQLVPRGYNTKGFKSISSLNRIAVSWPIMLADQRRTRAERKREKYAASAKENVTPVDGPKNKGKKNSNKKKKRERGAEKTSASKEGNAPQLKDELKSISEGIDNLEIVTASSDSDSPKKAEASKGRKKLKAKRSSNDATDQQEEATMPVKNADGDLGARPKERKKLKVKRDGTNDALPDAAKEDQVEHTSLVLLLAQIKAAAIAKKSEESREDDPLEECRHCSKCDFDMFLCGNCQVAKYCSEKCQRKHCGHKHKAECERLAFAEFDAMLNQAKNEALANLA
jgi:hypothetical protein